MVTDSTLARTRLIAEDGEEIVIPNKHIAGEVHINSYANRVVEGSVGVSYDDDPVQAIEVIRTVLAADVPAMLPVSNAQLPVASPGALRTGAGFGVLRALLHASNAGVPALHEAAEAVAVHPSPFAEGGSRGQLSSG